MPTSRRRFLATAASAALTTALAGCVATGPTVDADLSGPVFTSVTPTQSVSWGANTIAAEIGLTDAATTDRKVRQIVAVSGGSDVWTGSVVAGQTSVSGLLSVGAENTLFAVNASDEVVESVTVRVDASTIP
ncbi:hypothetical protein [Halobacterium zhouii]|uniref:hypothetical protein n=1 Tax=Halobacterium zhouii TaxID=2902624 RepID=UPI001E2F3B5D|nr:hypothetical protein [Halobacterium zhouii]